jgi:two-component system, OmpR family, phosphate regulon sensor histidine kinase PhoR
MNRAFVFVVVLLLASAVGWVTAEGNGAWAASAVVAIIWVAFESSQFTRFETMLKDPLRSAALWGHWAELGSWLQQFKRRQSEQTLSADQKLTDFLHAIQVSPNGVVMLDSSRRITWANQQAEGLLGIAYQNDEQQLITNIVRDPDFIDYLQSGQFNQECFLTSPRATAEKPLRLSIQLFEYGEGQSLLMARDVTSIERAEAIRRDFVANVSHEMRTPLTIVHGFIETLQQLPLERDQQLRYLASMGQQTKRMEALISDLLVLAKLDSETSAPVTQWSSLEGIVARVAAVSKALTNDHKIDWQVLPDIELAGEESQIESALSNLVSNAIRYSPAGSTITVQTNVPERGGLIISVQDEGAGIANEHLSRITERFYRVDKSRSRDSGGTGLGLAIVKHILTRHDAQLKIDSRLGYGSTFSIVWPNHRIRSHGTRAAA